MAAYLTQLIDLVVGLILVVLILNSLVSFMPIDPWHPARRFLNQLAEPILRPFRNIIPPVGMIDITPMIAVFVIWLVGRILVLLVQSAFR